MSAFVDVCAVDEIEPRSARTIVLNNLPIAIFRSGDGALFALVDQCPHKGGPLSDGMVVGRAAACPLHNWLTSLETESALGADSGCTQTLPLRVVGDRVELDVSALRTEKLHAV